MLPLFGHAWVYKVAGAFRDLTCHSICLAGQSYFFVSQYLPDDESCKIESVLKSITWSSAALRNLQWASSEIHGFVFSNNAALNPKHEIRISKQYKMTKIQIT
jgi:hypothetical protein